MIPRPCLGVGGEPCGRPTPGSRCPTHTRQHDRTRRPSPVERGYDATYRKHRAALIAAEPWCHTKGGCPYPPSPDNPLTADHVIPLRVAGPSLGLVVLCKRCNSAKGGRLGL